LISENSEHNLLCRTADGDERAFRHIFDQYHGMLGEFVFKITGSLQRSEEIVQDVFVKVWQNRIELKNIRNFKGYIFILCRNHTYNELKKKAVERKILVFMEHHEVENTPEAYQHDSVEMYRQLIDQAVDKLPKQAQKVYLLSRDERLKYDEIAALLGISSETVKKHIQYAKKFITSEVSSQINSSVLLVLMTSLILN
jgi:RNA polymerase sigma-70 factor (family 1)